MKAALEGLIFISGDDGITLTDIANILEISIDNSKELIKELYLDYKSDNRGIKLEYLGEHFKFTTKKEHKKYYEKLVDSESNKRLSNSALEVLSIIAYNGPISRISIDKIRGVNSSYIIRKLLLLELIIDCGKSSEPGRPLLYKVSDHFLNYFGLGSIDDLPKLEEVKVHSDDSEVSIFDTKYKED